jgi:5'-3' exonuclease
MKTDRTLVIDASSLVSVFIHATWPKGQIEGDGDGRVLWHTVKAVTRLVKDLSPTNVVICGDHGGRETRARRALLPTYKGHREHKPLHGEERRFFLAFCRKYLPVRVLFKIGYEADDLIAYVAENDAIKNRSVIIVSKDRDLLQLQQMFPDHVSCYDSTGQGFLSIKHEDVEFTWLKALTGDASDNIPSVTGEKTALKLLRGEYKQSLQEYLESGVTRSEKLPRMEVFKRNLRLVTLLGKGAYLKKIDFEDHPANYAFDEARLRQALKSVAPDEMDPNIDAIARTWGSFLGQRIMDGKGQGVVDWDQRRIQRDKSPEKQEVG